MTPPVPLSRLFSHLEAWRPPFATGIAHWYRTITTRRVVQRIGTSIAADSRGLLEFGDRSSEEFTALAESLATLDARLADVRVQATQLDDLLQERDSDRALSSAFELFRKSADLTHASIGIAITQEEQMALMVIRLLKNRDQFAQTCLIFRMLVMNIRTEAARIDADNQAIFGAVALEIGSMNEQMTLTVEKAFAQIAAIAEESDTGGLQLRKLESELHARAQQSIALLRSELDRIKRSLAPCAEASRCISVLLDRTRTQTSDLVFALHSQNIVRQQLEPVDRGFEDIATHLAPSDPKAGAVDLGYLHHVSRVQEDHLRSSREAIEKAARQIGDGSTSLLETGASLVARFTEMRWAADAVLRESQVSELFREETDNLVRVTHQSEATNQRITRLLQRIEECVRLFSTEIRHHEMEVKIVALNAQIAAARVPNAGALNKLSEQTALLSEQTGLLTQSMTAQLGETLTQLQHLRSEAAEAHETIAGEKSEITEGAALVSGKLRRLNERIHTGSDQVARDFAEAYGRVRDLLPTLTFPALIDSFYTPAEELCAALAEATVDFANAEMGAAGASTLAAHRNRYTMREEREADAAAVAGTAPATAPSPVESVELFGDLSEIPVKKPAENGAKLLAAAVPLIANHAEPSGVALF